MAIQKLTKTQLRRYRSGGGHAAYISFLKNLKKGEGGEATTEEEGVTKQTIKNRLNASADALDIGIKFKRSPANQVIFEVTKS